MSKGRYYCPKCEKYHRYTSKKGVKHLHYYEDDLKLDKEIKQDEAMGAAHLDRRDHPENPVEGYEPPIERVGAYTDEVLSGYRLPDEPVTLEPVPVEMPPITPEIDFNKLNEDEKFQLLSAVAADPMGGVLFQLIMEIRGEMSQSLSDVNVSIEIIKDILDTPVPPSADAAVIEQVDGLITRLGVEDSVKEVVGKIPGWGDSLIVFLTGKEVEAQGIPSEFQSEMRTAWLAKVKSDTAIGDAAIRAARNGYKIVLMSPEDELKAVELGVLDPEEESQDE